MRIKISILFFRLTIDFIFRLSNVYGCIDDIQFLTWLTIDVASLSLLLLFVYLWIVDSMKMINKRKKTTLTYKATLIVQ